MQKEKQENNGIKEENANDVEYSQEVDPCSNFSRKSKQAEKSILTNYFIPEMGISIKVDPEFKEKLIYKYQQNVTLSTGEFVDMAFFSTKEIYEVSNNCSGSLETIVKIKGKDDDYQRDHSSNFGFQQFNNFFVFYQGPQATCTIEKDGSYENFCLIELPALKLFNYFVVGKIEVSE